MDLSKLPKTTTRPKKRVGRGYASGKGGHTAGRGQKGQRSRSKLPPWFEGGQLPQIRRFPFIRGKSRFKSLKKEVVEINLSQLDRHFSAGSIINPKNLVKAGLVKDKELSHKTIKILGSGSIQKPLTIQLPLTQTAATKIKKAGGSIRS